MVTSRKKLLNLTTGLIFLTGILPVLLYGFGFIVPAGKLGELPFRESPLYEQWMIVIAAFGVKPTYMLLSLLLIIRLWPQVSLDLAALRWGVIAFLVGEALCSVNYLFFTLGKSNCRLTALIQNLNKSGMGCDTNDGGGSCTEDGDGIRIKVGQPADTGNNNTFRYNRLEKIGYNGIDVFGHTNTFENNVIKEACFSKGDCGGIRTFGSDNLSSTSVYNLAIRNNIIANTIGNTDGANTTYKALFGFGLYIDHYSKNVEISGNTVISSTVHGVLYQDSTGQMTGNTLYANNLGTMSGGQVNLTQSQTLVQPFTGNILYGLSSNTRTLIADSKTRLSGSNNNYFFNPYQNSHIYAEGAKTLAQWQVYSGMDGASKTHWFTQNPGDPLLSVIFYNETKASQVINLGNKKYLDLDQNQVIGNLTLAPFASKVLIDSGEVALAPAVLYFDNTASPPQTVTLKNITGSSLTIGITISPGFAQTNDCPANLGTGNT